MEDPFQNSVSLSKQEKPKALRLRLILGGIFFVLISLLLILTLSSFYFWRKNKEDDLIRLIPLDSVLYATFRNSFLSQIRIADLPFGNFYEYLAQKDFLKNADFYSLLNNTKRLSIALVPIDDGELNLVFIFKLIKGNFSKPIDGFEISDNIFVFSESARALEKIKEVKGGNIFSLASQISPEYLESNLFGLYLNSNNLKSYLAQKKDLANETLLGLLDGDLYIGLNKKSDQYNFSTKSLFKTAGNSRSEIIFDQLPNDFSFFISGINLFDLFSRWLKTNPAVSQSFSQTASGLELIYDLRLAEWASGFLNHDVDLLIFEPKQDSLLGFDYILASRNFSETDIDNLKKLINIVLAQKYPKESEYILSDGTKVVEYIADVDRWQWQFDQSDSNPAVNYLSSAEPGFEIAYAVEADVLYLASSAELLKNFFSQKGFSVSETLSLCKTLKSGSRGIIFNSEKPFFIPKIYLPEGVVVGQNGSQGLCGCILRQ